MTQSSMAKTQIPFPALSIILRFLLLLLNNVKSDSLSFNFTTFGPVQELVLAFYGDARSIDGVIQLTRRDEINGTVFYRSHSVGRVIFDIPLLLWEQGTGNLASFETEFCFVVNSAGSRIHADGLSFFIMPLEANPDVPGNSSGGYLGLFSSETAFRFNDNQIVAVEFDSFGNEWDPVPSDMTASHFGIDINTIESVKSENWPINSVPPGSIGKAVIRYDSKVKELNVTIHYTYGDHVASATVKAPVDLKHILPQLVRIGFSGATGDVVESHDILSWSFNSHM